MAHVPDTSQVRSGPIVRVKQTRAPKHIHPRLRVRLFQSAQNRVYELRCFLLCKIRRGEFTPPGTIVLSKQLPNEGD